MADSPKHLTPTQQRGQDILMEGNDSYHRKHSGPAFREGWERIWGKKVDKQEEQANKDLAREMGLQLQEWSEQGYVECRICGTKFYGDSWGEVLQQLGEHGEAEHAITLAIEQERAEIEQERQT